MMTNEANLNLECCENEVGAEGISATVESVCKSVFMVRRNLTQV